MKSISIDFQWIFQNRLMLKNVIPINFGSDSKLILINFSLIIFPLKSIALQLGQRYLDDNKKIIEKVLELSLSSSLSQRLKTNKFQFQKHKSIFRSIRLGFTKVTKSMEDQMPLIFRRSWASNWQTFFPHIEKVATRE